MRFRSVVFWSLGVNGIVEILVWSVLKVIIEVMCRLVYGWGWFTDWLFNWDYFVIQKWQFMVSVFTSKYFLLKLLLNVEWRLRLVQWWLGKCWCLVIQLTTGHIIWRAFSVTKVVMINISYFIGILSLNDITLNLNVINFLFCLNSNIFFLRNHYRSCKNLWLLLNLCLKCRDMSLCLPHALFLLRHKHWDLPLEFNNPLHHALPLFIFSNNLLVICLLNSFSQI